MVNSTRQPGGAGWKPTVRHKVSNFLPGSLVMVAIIVGTASVGRQFQ